MRARLRPKGIRSRETRNIFQQMSAVDSRQRITGRSGGIDRTSNVVEVLEDYTVSTRDFQIDCLKGGIEIRLPNAADCPGYRFRIKDVSGNAAASSIAITPLEGQTIDGETTYTISTDYGMATVRSIGSGWTVEHPSIGTVEYAQYNFGTSPDYAEITAAFGKTPSDVASNWLGILEEDSSDDYFYIIAADDTNWYSVAMTKRAPP